MELRSFTALDLFERLTGKEEFLLLDVRNDEEFGRFKVEGPYPFEMINVPYMEFIEHEPESVAKVPMGKPIRIVCAKEGSARYVGEILSNHGHQDVGYLLTGIKAWGNLLAPVRVHQETGVNQEAGAHQETGVHQEAGVRQETGVRQGDGYALYQFRRPGKASCSYGLLHENEMMVFDPAKNIAQYQAFADAHGCAIIRTFETHRQADYISGSWMLNQVTGSEIMAPEPDFKEARFHYTPVSDHAVYTFSTGGPEVKAIHTPGHTPGSTSFLIDGKFLVSGDTVFILSIGRPDLGGMAEEWSKLLYKTMTDKIIPMDDSTVALPGHYMDWKEANDDLVFAESLGNIKQKNSDIYSIASEKDFYGFIRENMRPQPDEYARIREINAGLVEVDEEQQDIMDLGKNECAASAVRQA